MKSLSLLRFAIISKIIFVIINSALTLILLIFVQYPWPFSRNVAPLLHNNIFGIPNTFARANTVLNEHITIISIDKQMQAAAISVSACQQLDHSLHTTLLNFHFANPFYLIRSKNSEWRGSSREYNSFSNIFKELKTTFTDAVDHLNRMYETVISEVWISVYQPSNISCRPLIFLIW